MQIICGHHVPRRWLQPLWCRYSSDPQGVRLALISPASLSGGLYLLFGDAHVILDPREDGGLNEEALVAHRRAPILQPGPLLLAALYEIHNLVKLLLVNLEESQRVITEVSGIILSIKIQLDNLFKML